MQLDYEQYKMVKEALHERANLLEIAPHLSFPLPIMLPVYKMWQVSTVKNTYMMQLLNAIVFSDVQIPFFAVIRVYR